MNKQPEALRLADALEKFGYAETDELAAAELRRLHALNAELLEVLKLALFSHGKLLLTDPPQDPWKVYFVESKARTVIAKAEGQQ